MGLRASPSSTQSCYQGLRLFSNADSEVVQQIQTPHPYRMMPGRKEIVSSCVSHLREETFPRSYFLLARSGYMPNPEAVTGEKDKIVMTG